MSKEEVEQLSKEEKLKLVETGHLFCKNTFTVGLIKKFINFIFEIILSAEFLVFAAFTVAFFFAMFKFNLGSMMWIWLTYAGISIVFIVARSIRIVLEQKTTLEIKAQASANATAALTGNLSELAGTVVDKIKGEKQ